MADARDEGNIKCDRYEEQWTRDQRKQWRATEDRHDEGIWGIDGKQMDSGQKGQEEESNGQKAKKGNQQESS